MKIELTLELYELQIPFLTSFKHASASRNKTQSVIVKVSNGVTNGFGEGCPREYVTNESIKSIVSFFKYIQKKLEVDVTTFEELKKFRITNNSQIELNLSGWCAIELAYLDLFSKLENKTIEEFLEIKFDEKPNRYSAVIGVKSFEGFAKDVQSYSKFGFSDFKLKISGDKEEDYKRLVYLKDSVKNCKIRIDANNLWEDIADVIDFVENSPCELKGIEEPLASKNLSELIELSQNLKCKIILDESFRTQQDLTLIQPFSDNFILNLRISKQGGLLNAIEIATKCISNKIELIIGSQVGETSILTRSSIALSRSINYQVRSMEGAFGELFLTEDITEKAIQFGIGGGLLLSDFIDANAKGNQLAVKLELINKYGTLQ